MRQENRFDEPTMFYCLLAVTLFLFLLVIVKYTLPGNL